MKKPPLEDMFVFNEEVIDNENPYLKHPMVMKYIVREYTSDDNFYYHTYIVSYVNGRKRKDNFYHWKEHGVDTFRPNTSYFSFTMPGLYEWMKAKGYKF